MSTKDNILILQEKEPFVLYKVLVEACRFKEAEYDESRNPRVLKEIQILRKLINRVFKLSKWKQDKKKINLIFHHVTLLICNRFTAL